MIKANLQPTRSTLVNSAATRSNSVATIISRTRLKLSKLIVLFTLILPFSQSFAVSIDWDDMGVGSASNIATGQTVDSLDDAADCIIAAPFTDCQVQVTITHELDNNLVNGPGEGDLVCGWGGTNCVRFYNDQIGGITDGDLRLGLDATGPDNDDDMRMCVEFNREVEGLQFEIIDIDDASWDDSVELTYVPFVNATPMLSRGDLINASAFGDITTGSDTNHLIEHTLGGTAPNNEVTGWGAIQAPTASGNAGAADDGGNVSIDFGTQQVGGFCIRYFAGPNSDANPGFQWIALSELTWTTTLPVDLAHVASSKTGRKLEVEWSTSAESFNLGFNVWGEAGGEWHSLHRNFVPSKVVDSIASNNYTKKLRLSKDLKDITSIGISSVDILGNEDFYGPFEIGEEYGDAVLPEPIDWQDAVARNAQRMIANGFSLKNGRWKKTNPDQPVADVALRADLDFQTTGMTRVHHAALLQAGLDLRGVPKNEIAVSYRGEAVARRVVKGSGGVFSEDSYIDFYVAPLSNELSLYNAVNTYQITQQPSLVRNVRMLRANSDGSKAESFSTQIKVENNQLYLNLSQAGSPWMDRSYGLGAIKTTEIELDLPENYLEGSDLIVDINLHGGFDHPAIDDDHIANVYVNGVEQGNYTWQGITTKSINVEIQASALSSDAPNVITLEGVPNAAGFALQYLDNYSVTYSLSESSLLDSSGFVVEGGGDYLEFIRNEVRGARGYAVDQQGNMVGLRRTRVDPASQPEGAQRSIRFALSSDQDARYFILSNDDFVSADSINVVSLIPTDVPTADLYIIAHPSFMGAELSGYAEHKRDIGVSTEIVDYQVLVEQLGYGLNDPYVIREFLNNQQAALHGSAALIVGGNTFDYLDRTGQGSISFIPTAYHQSSVIAYSPTDTPFTDLDQDGKSDVPVGRWPVRTLSDLNIIIDKSTAWGNNEGLASSTNVLLIAEKQDSNNGISFVRQLDNLSSRFDASNEYQGGLWGATTRLYARDFVDSATANADHKAALMSELEEGHALTIFNGHGSTGNWTNSGLLRSSDINAIQDQGKASIYFPLACYTTFYETIGNNSLAHQLLFKENGGAVTIIGAATLGEFSNNGRMADRFMQAQIEQRIDLGTALLTAKRSLGVNRQDESNLWTMLGDPTLRFNQAYVKPVATPTADGELSD